jgi:hypothetical protein
MVSSAVSPHPVECRQKYLFGKHERLLSGFSVINFEKPEHEAR